MPNHLIQKDLLSTINIYLKSLIKHLGSTTLDRKRIYANPSA